MTSKRSPRCIIIAGPNGAGKTTFAHEFLPNYAKVIHFVNADLIAAGLSPLQPEIAALRRAESSGQNLIAFPEVSRISHSKVAEWDWLCAAVETLEGGGLSSGDYLSIPVT